MKLYAPLNSFANRRVDDMPRVPTTLRNSTRDSGKYDSAGLPDLDRLLERTLEDIERAHVIRDRGSRDFNKLWNKVCKGLEHQKNATSFEHWKGASLAKKPIQAMEELRKKAAALWVERISIDRQKDPALGVECDNAFEAAERECENFEAKIKFEIDDIVEVAIAYWIEATNARKDHDDLRCLHALIECWRNIGKTLSARTESEAKSDAGGKQGKALRDAVATMVTNELNALEVTKKMTDPIHLLGIVVENIQRDPRQAAVLARYNAQATSGKKTTNKPEHRILDTLIKWVTAKKPMYPELVTAFERAHHQAHHAKNPLRHK